MTLRLNSVANKRDHVDSKVHGDIWRLARPLSFALLVGAIARSLLRGSKVFSTPSASTKETSEFMSATVPAKSNTPPDTINEAERDNGTGEPVKVTVTSPANSDNSFSQEGNDIFEKCVSSLSGFSMPLGSSKW